MLKPYTARLIWTAAILVTGLLRTASSTSYQQLYSSVKRAVRVAFNSLAVSSCLLQSVYVPNVAATQESKLESLYHIKKALPFAQSKEIYQDLVSSNDKAALYNLNRYLIDYTFGTITTVWFNVLTQLLTHWNKQNMTCTVEQGESYFCRIESTW